MTEEALEKFNEAFEKQTEQGLVKRREMLRSAVGEEWKRRGRTDLEALHRRADEMEALAKAVNRRKAELEASLLQETEPMESTIGLAY